MKNSRRTWFILIAAILVVQGAWYSIGMHDLTSGATKTVGTVIGLGTTDSNCPVRKGGFCDNSQEKYPLYQYYDSQGRKHTYEDRFFSAYKEGNPLGNVFGKQVGDTATLYYENDNPDQATVMGSLWLYVAMFIPLIIGVVVLIVYAVVQRTERAKK